VLTVVNCEPEVLGWRERVYGCRAFATGFVTDVGSDLHYAVYSQPHGGRGCIMSNELIEHIR
jgi:hypothetical protein